MIVSVVRESCLSATRIVNWSRKMVSKQESCNVAICTCVKH